jgi:hypothetical protein
VEGVGAHAHLLAAALTRLAPPQDVAQPQEELARLERLGEVILHACLEALDAVLGLGAGGQHADRDAARDLQLACELQPGLAGHHHVEQHDIEGEPAQSSACIDRVGGRRHAKAVLVKIAGEEIPDLLVVVDDEDVRGVVG